MKTIYLIIIALMFIVVTPEAYGGCGGGGEVADVDITKLPPTEQYQISDDISKNSHNVTSRPLRGSANPDRVDKHFESAIAFMNKHSTKKPRRNKNVDAIIAHIKLVTLLEHGPKALKRLQAGIDRVGAGEITKRYLLLIILDRRTQK